MNSELKSGMEVAAPPTQAGEPQPSVKELADKADKSREQGNREFKRGSAIGATKCYLEAIYFLNQIPVEDQSTIPLRLTILSNLAAAQLKAKNFEGCVTTCEIVLREQPTNVKALFRKGTAELNKGSLEDAFITLKIALDLEPTNKALIRQLTECKEQQKKVDKEQQEMYQRMVNAKKEKEDKNVCEDKEEKSGWGSWATWAAGAAGAAIVVGVGYATFKYLKA